MNRRVFVSTLGALCAAGAVFFAGNAAAAAITNDVNVVIRTNLGDIALRLDAKAAPVTVKNFVAYAKSGHYNNTVFHRVIDGFMIQGGGFTADMKQKATREPIVNEARGGLSNKRGTIAMARTSEPHSATSQFFINLTDNDFLDAANAQDRWGYTVFGRVTRGMGIVDKIGQTKTGMKAGFRDVPVTPVVIRSVTVE